MAPVAVSLPGFDSPAVGFEQPFEMLLACHQRVHRSLELLTRLVAHIEQHGHDEQSRSAAGDVLRYFDLAAPLHHEDEEVHVFPMLLAQDLPTLRDVIAQLQLDHRWMETFWNKVREHLSRWSQPGTRETISDVHRSDIARFCEIYDTHIQTEEGLVYPVAQALMSQTELANMGQAMQDRRRVH